MLLDDIELPDDLEWVDETSWTPIMQSAEYSATGSLLIQESEKQNGRPITLQGDNDMAWITRTVLDAVIAKRNQKGLLMDLVINSQTYKVMFRQSDTPIDVSPIRKGDCFDSGSYFKVNAIRLMEVE